MASGYINLTLRPIKLALLVNPYNKEDILKAIQINTMLWGGTYNPIIPIFKKKPKVWSDRKKHTAKEIVKGYLDFYDPDFIIPIGEFSIDNFNFGNRKIVQLKEIESTLTHQIPNYGISLFEILQDIIEKEYKFVRREPLKIMLPNCFGRYRLFNSCVFGVLSDECMRIFKKRFSPILKPEAPTCTLSNYIELLNKNFIFFRSITSYKLEPHNPSGLNGYYIFFMDANKQLDIIEYWNLRAMGYHVLPLPKQSIKFNEVKEFVIKYIDHVYSLNSIKGTNYIHTKFLKSLNTTKSEMRSFTDSLNLGEIKNEIRYNWLPHIWDEWYRESDGIVSNLECVDLRSDFIEYDFAESSEKISFKTLAPKFINRRLITGTPRFANDMDLRFYETKEIFAEVIPESGFKLAEALKDWDFDAWRFTKKGITYLSNYVDNFVRISIPIAEEVFLEWLKGKGWVCKLSDPGIIAKKMIKQLGDKFWISLLANEDIIRLLEKINNKSSNIDKLYIEVNKLYKFLKQKDIKKIDDEIENFYKKIKIHPIIEENTIEEDSLKAEIYQIINKLHYNITPEEFLQKFIEKNIFQLGIKIQCPTCRRHSFYSIKNSIYELECPKCLEKFNIPACSPSKDIKWTYRTYGTFSVPNQSAGSFTVLLTYRFFSQLLEGATTPIMSFKDKSKNIEADLGLFYQRYHHRQEITKLIFVECKTFNRFKIKDKKRMLFLSKKFPKAILVFSTLNKSLDDNEKKLIRDIAMKQVPKWAKGQPFNPILILTGIELFSNFAPPKCWINKGKNYEKFEKEFKSWYGLDYLSEITCQIYLGMKSKKELYDEIYKKSD